MFLLLMLDLTMIFVWNLSPLGNLHDAAENADFPEFDPDPVGVAGGVAKIKVVYDLVLLTGIPLVHMICACHAPFGWYLKNGLVLCLQASSQNVTVQETW